MSYFKKRLFFFEEKPVQLVGDAIRIAIAIKTAGADNIQIWDGRKLIVKQFRFSCRGSDAKRLHCGGDVIKIAFERGKIDESRIRFCPLFVIHCCVRVHVECNTYVCSEEEAKANVSIYAFNLAHLSWKHVTKSGSYNVRNTCRKYNWDRNRKQSDAGAGFLAADREIRKTNTVLYSRNI